MSRLEEIKARLDENNRNPEMYYGWLNRDMTYLIARVERLEAVLKTAISAIRTQDGMIGSRELKPVLIELESIAEEDG